MRLPSCFIATVCAPMIPATRMLVPFLLAAATSVAHGEPVVVSGLGTLACANLTAQVRPDDGYKVSNVATAALSWVQGYVSAWNVIGIIKGGRFADLTSLSVDEQWSYVSDFCRRNPDGFVLDAARALLATRLKMQTVSPLGDLRNGFEGMNQPTNDH